MRQGKWGRTRTTIHRIVLPKTLFLEGKKGKPLFGSWGQDIIPRDHQVSLLARDGGRVQGNLCLRHQDRPEYPEEM